MQTFTIKGNAINLFIKAENKEEAEKIVFSPLTETVKNLSTVWFEHK